MKLLKTSVWAALLAIGVVYAMIGYSNEKEPEQKPHEPAVAVAPSKAPTAVPGGLPASGEAAAGGSVMPEPVPSPTVPAENQTAVSKPVIYLDPGHQRKGNNELEPVAPGSKAMKPKVSGGTTGVSTGKPEYVLNLEVAVLLKQMLEEQGMEVLVTREEHDVDISNKQRAELANEASARLAVRLHADGNESPKAEGFSVLYPHPSVIPDEAVQASSLKAAELIHDSLKESTGAKSRGIVPRQDLSGFNWSTVPVVLVEMGFMTNPAEDVRMSDPDYQRKLAEGMAQGIVAYIQTS
ncbi:N-acetylmuramoyl-L-alanine amidase [Paenibacillus sp. NPDC056579]|uniref:N-acetylmuramoyl-L-alanine amidase family protein n=1 Tax=Paenibacillus sp. NPDC056579 TaxID=3345871 RepID=UPI0036AE25B7